MKKVISLLLCAVLLTACGDTDEVDTPVIPEPEITQPIDPEPTPQIDPEPTRQIEPEPEIPTETPVQLPSLKPAELPRLDGSTATIPLAEALVALMLDIPRAEAADLINFSGTNSAYHALIGGRCDLVIAYEPPDESLEYYEDREDFTWEIAPIGRDALVFIINESNPVQSITTEQARAIYTGEITNWSELGGNDVAIEPFQRNATSGSQTLFLKLVMGDTEPMTPETRYMSGGMGPLIEAVSSFNNTGAAIGFSVYYYAQNMNPGDGLKFLAIDDVIPTTESIQNGSYPHVNDFYAAISAETPQDSVIRQIYNWLQSDEGRMLIEHEGYVGIGVENDLSPFELLGGYQTVDYGDYTRNELNNYPDDGVFDPETFRKYFFGTWGDIVIDDSEKCSVGFLFLNGIVYRVSENVIATIRIDGGVDSLSWIDTNQPNIMYHASGADGFKSVGVKIKTDAPINQPETNWMSFLRLLELANDNGIDRKMIFDIEYDLSGYNYIHNDHFFNYDIYLISEQADKFVFETELSTPDQFTPHIDITYTIEKIGGEWVRTVEADDDDKAIELLSDYFEKLKPFGFFTRGNDYLMSRENWVKDETAGAIERYIFDEGTIEVTIADVHLSGMYWYTWRFHDEDLKVAHSILMSDYYRDLYPEGMWLGSAELSSPPVVFVGDGWLT